MLAKAIELHEKSKDRGFKVYKNHIAFWGSKLSNFYPCEFELQGVKWKSSEQYFMAKKAEFFDDNETLSKILEAKTPSDAKKLGREVKNYDDNKWSKIREKIMYNGVYAKFSQNQDLIDFLFSPAFDGKKFVEGSPVDRIWGVGMIYKDPNIDIESNWNGQNLLGRILDRVKSELTR
jgi:ribA/ribD-fused uncharacterized protein